MLEQTSKPLSSCLLLTLGAVCNALATRTLSSSAGFTSTVVTSTSKLGFRSLCGFVGFRSLGALSGKQGLAGESVSIAFDTVPCARSSLKWPTLSVTPSSYRATNQSGPRQSRPDRSRRRSSCCTVSAQHKGRLCRADYLP